MADLRGLSYGGKIGKLPPGRPSTAVSTVLTGEIATTANGRDITQQWVGQLRQPLDRRLWNATDWGVYDRILTDDQVWSCFQQRRMAVTSRPWMVLPGDDSPQAQESADALTNNLSRIGWDRITDRMLFASFYGFSAGELIWAPMNGRIEWQAIKVKHGRRFRWDEDWRLRLLTPENTLGEILPDRKFWTVRAGGDNDDLAYGRGLAEFLYWPTYFKREGVRAWMLFQDKLAVPTTVGKYQTGTAKEQVANLLAAMAAISTDSAIAIPAGMEVALLEASRSPVGDFETLAKYMDGAISKVILSQTMTTDHGSSRAQGQVHEKVKLEIIKADADLLSDSFNEGPAAWWHALNFGDSCAPPRVVRVVEEEADLKSAADTDAVLATIGWERTKESFEDVYGDGYEYTGRSVGAAQPGVDGAAPALAADLPETVPGEGAAGKDAASVAMAGLTVPDLPGGDDIDAIGAAIAADGWREVVGPMVDPVLSAIDGAATFAEAADALIPALAKMDASGFTSALERAGFAVRASADAAGVGETAGGLSGGERATAYEAYEAWMELAGERGEA